VLERSEVSWNEWQNSLAINEKQTESLDYLKTNEAAGVIKES